MDSDRFTYGWIITFIGMGGTVLSLWVMTLVINVLKKLFPYREAEEEKGKEAV